MGTAIMHSVPNRVKLSFIIFDIRALWHSALSIMCQDVKNNKWWLNPVWHRMLYSCTHMATVGVKGLIRYAYFKMLGIIWLSFTPFWCRKRWRRCHGAQRLLSSQVYRQSVVTFCCLRLTALVRTCSHRSLRCSRPERKIVSCVLYGLLVIFTVDTGQNGQSGNRCWFSTLCFTAELMWSNNDEVLLVHHCILWSSSCMALSAGQLSREMYSRLMLSINGVGESC